MKIRLTPSRVIFLLVTEMVSSAKQKSMSTPRHDFARKLSTVVSPDPPAAAETIPTKPIFIHHVYFWLKNPDSKEDKARLLDGLYKLSKVSTIRKFHIGVPAATSRDVIDRSYSASWLAIFDDQPAQDSYQDDPIHLKFVNECSLLWSKVIVYDSVDA